MLDLCTTNNKNTATKSQQSEMLRHIRDTTLVDRIIDGDDKERARDNARIVLQGLINLYLISYLKKLGGMF